MTVTNEVQEDINEFNEKWKRHIDKFLEQPSLELETFKNGGLLEDRNRNIVEHLLKARAISETMCDLFGLKGEEKENVVAAATVHDSFVLEEKAYIRQKTEKGEGANFKDLQDVKAKSAKKLKSIGFPDNVISLVDENITHEDGGPKDISSMIIFYTDAILSGPDIVDVPLRFDLTRRGYRSDLGREDEKTRKGNLKYWNEFFKGAPGHGDRPHDEVQLETADRIAKEFITMLKKSGNQDVNNPKYDYIFSENGDPNKLAYYIEDKLKENILTKV